MTIIHRNLEASAVIQGLVKGIAELFGYGFMYILRGIFHRFWLLFVTAFADRNIFTGLMVDPRTKALVLNGKPGHLQFYSLQSDKQLYNVRFYPLTSPKMDGNHWDWIIYLVTSKTKSHALFIWT